MFLEACYLEIENEKVDKEKLDKRKYNGLVIDIRHSNFNMIKKVKSETRLPVLIAGVMSKDDALECLDYQPDGIIITCQNTIDQLTAVCKLQNSIRAYCQSIYIFSIWFLSNTE